MSVESKENHYAWEILGDWLRDVLKTSQTGCAENAEIISQLNNSFPVIPDLQPEIRDLRNKISTMSKDNKCYDRELTLLSRKAYAVYTKSMK